MIPVPLPCSSDAPEFCFVRVIMMQQRTVPKVCGIERKILGQCDCDIGIFESIQIKTILNREFEIVLKLYLKRSKSSSGNARKSGLSCYRTTASINPCRAISSAKSIIGAAVVAHLTAIMVGVIGTTCRAVTTTS
jgi:hypothetical protein